MIKHKIQENKYSKEHFTAMTKINNNCIAYNNETTKKEIFYLKYHKDAGKYIESMHNNSYLHKGSICNKKIAYYTPTIITEKENIVLTNNSKNFELIKNIKEENINNILASFSINLNETYWENKWYKINGINKNTLMENIKLKKTIDLFKNNKDTVNTEQYESILGMSFFWEENEKLINELKLSQKIELCEDLKIEYDSSSKEINFQCFKDIINKK